MERLEDGAPRGGGDDEAVAVKGQVVDGGERRPDGEVRVSVGPTTFSVIPGTRLR